MINFFRQIRRSLINQNQMGKYFKYAIGEILLVMIGILLALQVNNWNEERKQSKLETVLLKQLQTEFNSNLSQIEQRIEIRNNMIKAAVELIKYIDNPEIRQIDSINKNIAWTTPYTTFDPIVNDIVASGNSRILKNNRLQQLLSLWTSEIIQVTEGEQTWLRYRDNIYLPFLVKHYQMRTMRSRAMENNILQNFLINQEQRNNRYEITTLGDTKYDADIDALLDTPDYEDHLVRLIVTNRNTQHQSYILRERIVEIIELIESEINKK
jgi:hypothetical protein